jgi:hypothetical protein
VHSSRVAPEAAVELREFLAQLTQTIERHYCGALHRLDQERRAHNRDPDCSPVDHPQSDPPF